MEDAITLFVTVGLRVSVIFGAAWLVTLALRRASASARYMVWTCAIAAAVFMPVLLRLPAWQVPLPAITRWSPALASGEGMASGLFLDRATVTDEAATTAAGIAPASAVMPSRVAPMAVAVGVWAAGFVAVLLYVLIGMIATSRLRRTGTRATASWTEDARALAGAMGIARVTFAESALSPVPFVCGVIRPLVIMPDAVSSWTSDRLRVVLLHELAHVKRRDCLTQLLTRFACAIYWFHPLVWLAAHRLHVERERACDDFVLTSGVRGSEYARHLVDIAKAAVSRRSLFAAAGVAMAHRGRLERRLMSILDPHLLRSSPLSARLVVGAFGLFALAGASLQVQAQAPTPAPVQAPAPAQTPETSSVTFEVASIKRNREVEAQRLAINPNIPTVPGRAQTRPGGVLMGRGMTVRELIRDAYGYRNRAHGDIVGGPGWLDTERYDVQAKAGRELGASSSMGLPPAAEAALRAMLAERMNLKIRKESPVRPVYELVLHREDRRLGPNLTPSKGGCIPFFQREAYNAGLVIDQPKAGEPPLLRPCPLMIAPGTMGAENMTMEEWARLLALAPQLNRTVIDRTGLTGGFDIMIKDPDAGEPGRANLLPAMKPALESQLGLTLRNAEAPVEVLVIESVERPTEN